MTIPSQLHLFHVSQYSLDAQLQSDVCVTQSVSECNASDQTEQWTIIALRWMETPLEPLSAATSASTAPLSICASDYRNDNDLHSYTESHLVVVEPSLCSP